MSARQSAAELKKGEILSLNTMRFFLVTFYLLGFTFSVNGNEQKATFFFDLEDGSRFMASVVKTEGQETLFAQAENVENPILINLAQIRSMERVGLQKVEFSANSLWSLRLRDGNLLRGELKNWNSSGLSLAWEGQELQISSDLVAGVSRISASLPASGLDEELWKISEGIIFQGGYAYLTKIDQSLRYDNLPRQGLLSLAWLPDLAQGSLLLEIWEQQAGERERKRSNIALGANQLNSKDYNGKFQALELAEAGQQRIDLQWDYELGEASLYLGEQRIDFPLPQLAAEDTSWNLTMTTADAGSLPFFVLTGLELLDLEDAPRLGLNQGIELAGHQTTRGLVLEDGSFLAGAEVLGIEVLEAGKDSLRNFRIQTQDGEVILLDERLFSTLWLDSDLPQKKGEKLWQIRFQDGQVFSTSSYSLEGDSLLIPISGLGELSFPLEQLLAIESL